MAIRSLTTFRPHQPTSRLLSFNNIRVFFFHFFLIYMTINTPGRDMVWSNRFCWFSFFSLLFSFSLFSSFLLSSLDAFCGVRVDRVLGGRSFLTPIVFFFFETLTRSGIKGDPPGREAERERGEKNLGLLSVVRLSLCCMHMRVHWNGVLQVYQSFNPAQGAQSLFLSLSPPPSANLLFSSVIIYYSIISVVSSFEKCDFV